MTERERELGAALREIEYRCLLLNEHKLGKSARYREVSRIQFLASYFRVKFSADALAASPEAAPRLPGAVLQANEDGTISKVEPQPDEELATNAYLMGRNSKTREAEARGMEMLLEWQLKKQAKYGGQSVDFIAAHRAAGEGE